MASPALCTRPNGTVLRAWADESSLTVDGQSLPIPTEPLYLTIAATDSEWAAFGQGHQGAFGGAAMLIRQNGDVENLGPASGMLCTGIRRAGDRLIAVWVNPGQETYSEYDLETKQTVVKPIIQAPGTSQGFIGFDSDGTPRWTDTHRSVTVNGIVLSLPAPPVNGWNCGQSNRFFGVEAVSPAGEGFVVVKDTPVQLPPQLVAHSDGSLEACYSFPTNDPSALFVKQAQWTPVLSAPAPAPVPEPPVPTPQPIPPPVEPPPVPVPTPPPAPPVTPTEPPVTEPPKPPDRPIVDIAEDELERLLKLYGLKIAKRLAKRVAERIKKRRGK